MDKGRIAKRPSGFGRNQTRSSLALPLSTQAQLRRAWVLREQEHETALTVVRPHRTLAVSVTGDRCDLDCRHCRGHYLHAMTPVDSAVDIYRQRAASSCLISGGCNSRGYVPVWEHEGVLKELKGTGARLNCHVGTCDAEQASRLRGLVDCVSFDLIGDDDTLREVYGVDYGIDRLWNSYRQVAAAVPTYPHICIGLRGGRISGEYALLERLAAEDLPGIVFLILRPTPNTPYGQCAPPPVDEVASFVAFARMQFPRTPLYLGCMRPGGRYRTHVDQVAIGAGVQKIVKPTPATVSWARQAGLSIDYQEECCVL